MTLTPEATKSQAVEPLTQQEAIASMGTYGYGWADSDVAGASAQRGLSEAVVRDISGKKSEPEWMLQTRLKAEGIATGLHYPIPVHLQKAHLDLGYAVGDFPESEKAAKQVLSLPIYPEMTSTQVDKVVAAVEESAYVA